MKGLRAHGLGRVGLKLVGSVPIVRIGGVLDTLQVARIVDVSHLRKATIAWITGAAGNGQTAPLFNWVAVFNFNARGNSVVLSLYSGGPSGGRVEALMLVKMGHVVRCDHGGRDRLVYVSFLEVAPWNRPDAPQRLFAGLGPVMLGVAADLSKQHGYGGRVGLHSVASAEDFYRRMGFRSLDCPSEHNELYFDLDEDGAEALVGDKG